MKIYFKTSHEMEIKDESGLFEKIVSQIKENKKPFMELQDEEGTHMLIDVREIFAIKK